MSQIANLSDYQYYQLRSLDPELNKHWQKTIHDIFATLNSQNQQIIFEQILKPKGLVYDPNDQHLSYLPSERLSTIESETFDKPKINQIFNTMQLFLDKTQIEDIIIFAKNLEAILKDCTDMAVNDKSPEYRLIKRLKRAFLYELAKLIDDYTFTPPALNVRKLDIPTIKSYLKEVFIKQQIQAWDFPYFENSEAEQLLQLADFPEFLIKPSQARKVYIAKTEDYWFLVAPTSNHQQNPFAFSRFLHEDGDDPDGQYVYLNHIAVANDIHDDATKAHLINCCSRIYTLDQSISDILLDYAEYLKETDKNILKPLIKTPLVQNGQNPETIVSEHLSAYEKQIDSFALRKAAQLFDTIANNPQDINYLYYHLDKLCKNLINDIQAFRLQPLFGQTQAARISLLRILCLRTLLQKTQKYITNSTQINQLPIVKAQLLELLLEKQEEMIGYQEARLDLLAQENNQAKKGFFARLFQKTPNYTQEDLAQSERTLADNTFDAITQLLSKSPIAINITLEFPDIIQHDQTSQYYALPTGNLGIDQLPLIITLPKEKADFDFNAFFASDTYRQILDK